MMHVITHLCCLTSFMLQLCMMIGLLEITYGEQETSFPQQMYIHPCQPLWQWRMIPRRILGLVGSCSFVTNLIVIVLLFRAKNFFYHILWVTLLMKFLIRSSTVILFHGESCNYFITLLDEIS